MCGIAGFFRFDGVPASKEDLGTMVGAMHHRGPDGSGCYVEGPFGLGMSRLAIIDVAGGQQPIFNEDHTLAIVCNGEIYNYTALRSELAQRGHRFRTCSDVEVILHLYEEQGAKCFSRLNGMFGAAIADFTRNRLVLARDPFGQKPLYLWRRSGLLAFASELKALAGLPGFSRKVSQAALASYLQFRYVPAPMSIFEGVEKLPPGSSLSVDVSGQSEVRRYWQIGFDDLGEPADAGDIRQRLIDSTERHLMSERPLGVFLSGGLDSSAIVACMHLAGHKDIHTYTVGFEDHEDNEFETARQVSQHFRTAHQEVLLSPEDFWTSLDAVVYSADEPLADLTTVPLYHLSRYASRDVVVVLSGEGADELLAGYPGMEDLRKLSDRIRAIRPLRPLAKRLQNYWWPHSLKRRLQAAAGSEADYLARHPYSMTNVFDADFRRRFCLNGIAGEDPLKPLAEYYRSRQNWNAVDLCLGVLAEWWLPDDLLHKADRMTMSQSIELRCPFLDTEFSNYCTRLSLDEKVRNQKEEPSRKIALKRAFAGVLPENIVYQRKKGFAIPVYRWLETIFAGRARMEMERPGTLSASLFSKASRAEMADRAAAGDKLSQYRVWALIVLNKWGDRWL